jgi:MOSC domain-containing protein YiiM
MLGRDQQLRCLTEVFDRETNNVTVSDILRLYLGQTRDRELLQRAANISSLPENWRTQLLLKTQTHV